MIFVNSFGCGCRCCFCGELQSPPLLHHNGRLIGYYVGYKRYNSSTPYLYVTVPAAGTVDGDDWLRCQLDELDKYTLYGVHVQAYNAKGAGPRSADIVVMTLEDGRHYTLLINTDS